MSFRHSLTHPAQLVSQQKQDSKFNREVFARIAYEQLHSQPPEKQERLLKAYRKRYEGTYFADQVATDDKE
ncbi:MAG: hypothetical protein KDA86_22930 [Planctomycetaceae bacterium]|nr:hypothetical protein [Planctomycetaceae bacterium]